MAGRFLEDTDIVIALIRSEDAVLCRLAQTDEAWLSAPVLGELHSGAFNSDRVQENLAIIDRLARRNGILVPGAETARRYGSTKAQLRASGRLIPDTDIWIAALAIQHNLTVAARDEHFRRVAGLHYEMW